MIAIPWSKVCRVPTLMGFTLAAAACASTPETTAPELRPISVADVRIEVGVGSPIPADILVSGTWPDLCAQLAEVTQAIDGFQIQVDLLATAVNPGCPPDLVGVPFRMAIPLNVVELPEGTYNVSANGVSTTFDWPASP